MPFPLATPAEMLQRSQARVEAAIRRARPNVDPVALDRAIRSEKGLISILLRDGVMTAYEVQLHLRWLGDQLLPDTAQAEYLIRHAGIWGIYKRPATKAVGYAGFTGVPGTVVPAGLELRLPVGLAITTSAGAIGGGGTLTLPVQAAEGGAAGNALGLTRLPVVTVLAGLDPQEAHLDADGLAGGAEEETNASLLARLLVVIREPGHGGAFFDYPVWVQNTFAAVKVRTLPLWTGPGSVGVVVAMGSVEVPRVPTPAELAAIATHLSLKRPVTAEVHTLAVILRPEPMTLAVAPDTAQVRAAVDAARKAYLAAEAEIGIPIYRSRLSEALSAASGEYRHYMIAPAADIATAARELVTAGPVTWQAPP